MKNRQFSVGGAAAEKKQRNCGGVSNNNRIILHVAMLKCLYRRCTKVSRMDAMTKELN